MKHNILCQRLDFISHQVYIATENLLDCLSVNVLYFQGHTPIHVV